MDLKEKDFSEFQTSCKYSYIGDHGLKILCDKYYGWVDCNYNHCPFIMKPCKGTLRINGEIVGNITAINTIY